MDPRGPFDLVAPGKGSMIFRDSTLISALDDPARLTVRELFVRGFNLQMRILMGFAAAQFPATLLSWQQEAILID